MAMQAPAPAPVPELRLRLLGGLAAFLDDRALTELRSAKAGALLAYLAVTGRRQPRAFLAGLLWPSLDDAAARLNLRQVLHVLRRLVGDHIAVTRTDVVFRRGPGTDVDVHILEDGTSGAPPEGEFLVGFSLPDAPGFDDWTEAQRQRLQRLAARRWAEHAEQLRHSDPVSAVLAADRVLALDPWNERALRHLMKLLAENGQRGTALIRFDTFRRRLADELGVDPEPETRLLHQRLLLERTTEAPGQPPVPRVRAPLPVPPTRLIGRTEQLDQLDRLLGDPATRLVTLVGPGGVGKTRLALEAARRYDSGTTTDSGAGRPAFPDGVVLVPLDVVPRYELIGPTVLAALGRPDASNNRLQAIVEAVQDRRVLLVLDNLEHLPGVAPRIAQLVASCPSLHVLATSRTALNLRAETVLDVPPLSVPDLAQLPPAAALDQIPAVALLLERMRRQLPGLDLDQANARPIAELCVRLDGLPLALELAAGRARTYGPAALASLLDSDTRLLDEGPVDLPARHRSLTDTLAWSHTLLSPAEQRLFRRLSVFAGSWTLAAAEAVCGDEDDEGSGGPAGPADPDGGVAVLLPRLLVHSLLRALQGIDGEPRFGMLRTIRDFAARQLDAAGEAHQLRRRHAEYYRAVAAAEAAPLRTAGQAAALRRLAADHDNIRRAMRTFVTSGQAALAAEMAWSLWLFWYIRAHFADTLRMMELVVAALEAAGAGPEPLARARTVAGDMAYPLGELDRGRELLDGAIAAAREAGADDVLAAALMARAHLATITGDRAMARSTVEESYALFMAQDDPLGAALTSTGMAYLPIGAGDRAGATRALGRSEQWARKAGAPFGVLMMLGARLLHLAEIGDPEAALRVAGEMIEMAVELGDGGGIGYALLGVAYGSAERGDLESAALVFAAEERLRELTGTSLLLRSNQKLRAAQLAGVRSALPASTFDRLIRQGRAMSLPETITMARTLTGAARR